MEESRIEVQPQETKIVVTASEPKEIQSSTHKFPKTSNKTVCIVATGYSWDSCVFAHPDKDYWTLNNMYEAGSKPKDYDEWFQIHRPNSGEGHVDDAAMREFLRTWERPVWVQKDWGKELYVKNPWIYPIDEVMELMCPRDVNGIPYPYFTNSIDYMVCLAVLRGYKEIQLYGVEFISRVDDEYYTMRQSVNFYIGRALEKGINVVIQPQSSLLKCGHWYGYETKKKDPLEKLMAENKKNLEKQQGDLQKKLREIQRDIDTLIGGIRTLDQCLEMAKLREKGAQI